MEKTKDSFYDLVLGQIVNLKATRDELGEVLGLYEVILRAQRKIKLAFKVDLADFDTKIGLRRNSQGLPFLRPGDVQIDQDLFYALLESINNIIEGKTKEIVSSTLKRTYLDEECETLLGDLMGGGSNLERTVGKMKTDSALFSFLVAQSFSPFLESYAERLRQHIDSSSWLRGYCPVCGGEPLMMARLEKETGKKWLFCSLCHSEWRFKRLKCSFCGNDNQESLRYFYSENEEAYRVDVCDKCKRYTKTVDARKTESIRNLFVEDLATLSLNIVAEREGFLSRGNFFLS